MLCADCDLLMYVAAYSLEFKRCHSFNNYLITGFGIGGFIFVLLHQEINIKT